MSLPSILFQAALAHAALAITGTDQPATPPDLASAETYIAACRNAINGGDRIGAALHLGGHDVYCIYDAHLQNPDLGAVAAQASPADGLVVFSNGGSITGWLDLVEALEPPFDFIIVDRVCMSSCANYAFPAAQEKIVPEDALVVWHGGPAGDDAFLARWWRDVAGGREATEADWARMRSHARRTEALYALTGVSVRLLQDSHRPPAPGRLARRRAGVRTVEGGGIAFPPSTLSACFGMNGLSGMRHPGDNQATMRAGVALAGPHALIFSEAGDADEDGCRVRDDGAGG